MTGPLFMDIDFSRIPRLWAHKHFKGESVTAFDDEFVTQCEICMERFQLAIAEGRRCPVHPFSLFDAKTNWCEDCDAAKSINGGSIQ